MYEKEKAAAMAYMDEHPQKKSKIPGRLLTTGGALAGVVAGKFGSLKLAQILGKTRPDLLKKLTSGAHAVAKKRLDIGSDVAAAATGLGVGTAAHRASKD